MKKGILNLPDKTLSLRDCKEAPSKGSAPQTRTYNTTPRLWHELKILLTFFYDLSFIGKVFSFRFDLGPFPL